MTPSDIVDPQVTLRRRQLLAAGIACAMVGPLRAADETASVSAPLLDGQVFTSQGMAAQALLISFWSLWCPACRHDLPLLDAYYRQRSAQGLAMLALNLNELNEQDKVREVVRSLSVPVGMMKAARLSGFARIWRMPVLAVLDKHGRLIRQDWYLDGEPDPALLDAVIGPLL